MNETLPPYDWDSVSKKVEASDLLPKGDPTPAEEGLRLPECPQAAPYRPPLPARGRLVVLESVTHYSPLSHPITVNPKSSKWLESDKPPVMRHMDVGPDWVQVDTAWIEQVSQMVIENVEGIRLQRYPTPEEKRVMESRVVQVKFMDEPEIPYSLLSDVEIPAGESCRFRPAMGVYLRCQTGPARVVISIFPR